MAISRAGGGGPAALDIVTKIRNGLRAEGYNLNAPGNMVVLPLLQDIADVVRLPVHRRTKARTHDDYGDYVRLRLNRIFDRFKSSFSRCEDQPDYLSCKTDLEDLSSDLYADILSCRATVPLDQSPGSLDEMARKRP